MCEGSHDPSGKMDPLEWFVCIVAFLFALTLAATLVGMVVNLFTS